MAKMTEEKLTDIIYRGLVTNSEIGENGVDMMPLGENQISVSIGVFDEKGVQVNPQRFVICIVED